MVGVIILSYYILEEYEGEFKSVKFNFWFYIYLFFTNEIASILIISLLGSCLF